MRGNTLGSKDPDRIRRDQLQTFRGYPERGAHARQRARTRHYLLSQNELQTAAHPRLYRPLQ